MRKIKMLFSLLLTLTVTGVIAAAAFYLYLRTQALPATHMPQTTNIYDVNGHLLEAPRTGQNRSFVPLDRISPYVMQATIAIEDRRFYRHFGIDPRGLARAVVVNLSEMDKVQGASTITQQLARNLYLSLEKTYERKIREAIYSLQLEMKYSKDEILEMYLNQIYFGHSTYGIQAAAQLFFGKDAADLTLAESALLAGVPKGPRFYSPYYNENNAKARQRDVLNAMVELGYITQEQADEAYREPLNYMPLEKQRNSADAPYFRDYVRSVVTGKLGIDESTYEEGGIRIHTTLDLRMQDIAEEAVRNGLKNADPDLQVALVAIDPRNGHIKALVGGRDYGASQFNRVFTTSRQPGSSFKPLVYLTALQEGSFTPVTRIESKPTSFVYDQGRKTYAPKNFGNQYYGEITLREAIARSDNIYAVSTIMEIGADKVIDTARKLGITSPLSPLPSLALGSFPVSPFEMVYAFGAIANQGVKTEPVAVLRIEDAQGRVLYEASPASERVIEPEYAYVLTKLMESVFEPGGTGYRVAHLLKRPVAAKTGTTDTDAWMIGFTPELAVAVWVGYDQGRPIRATESHLATPIFAEFVERALAAVPPKIFEIPDGVVHMYVDPATGLLAGPDCPEAYLEAFVRGTEPTEPCLEHGGADEFVPETPAEEVEKSSWWKNLKRWWGG